LTKIKCHVFVANGVDLFLQGSNRSGKTGKSQGFCVVRENQEKVRKKILFLKSQGK